MDNTFVSSLKAEVEAASGMSHDWLNRGHVPLDGKMIMNSEWVAIWKLELFQHLSGATEANHSYPWVSRITR
jgi:hypothetical protein